MPGPVSDPLQYLPYDVWVRIIQFYSCDQAEGPLPLLDVSLSWQAELLQAPEVWTTVYFDGGHDEESRGELFFYQAKTELVNVIMDRNSEAMDITIRYGDKIRSLTFRTKSSKEYSSADISRFSHKLGSRTYPNIIRIDVEPPCYLDDLIPATLIRACPALVSIHGAYLEPSLLPTLSPSTTKLGVLGDGMLPDGIGDKLEVLRIRCNPSTSKKPLTCKYFTAPTRLMKFELEFGVETRALLAGQANPFRTGAQYLLPLNSFSSEHHHSLQVLSLTMPWYDVFRIFPLSSFTALRELRLVLDCAIKSSSPTWLSESGDASRIQKFSLSSTPRNSLNSGKTYLPQVIDSFTRNGTLENVEEIHLAREDENIAISTILDLLGTTKNLRRLHLTRNEGANSVARARVGIDEVDLPELHTLLIFDDYVLKHISFIAPKLVYYDARSIKQNTYPLSISFANHLESMNVPGAFFCAWNDQISLYSKDNGTLPRLRSLNITPGQLYSQPKASLNFLNLRKVYFEEDVDNPRSGKGVIGDSLLNYFLLEILFSPDNCPNLSTIGSNRYPSWALAVGALHRRNSSKTVFQILSFRLCGQPQIVILALMTRGIEAMGTDSGHIVSEAVLIDQTLHQRWAIGFYQEQACQDCIMSGFVACVPTTEKRKRKDPPNDPKITQLLDFNRLQAPVNRTSPLTRADWEAHLLNTAISSDYAMRRPCNRHKQDAMFHIGSNTLDGTTCDIF